jgi:hypothetical protein
MNEFIEEQSVLTPSLEQDNALSDDLSVQLFIARETMLVALE